MPKTAIIIGAGPAGLTAAFELLQHTDIIPVVVEANADVGGLSKTIIYKGNRLDIGPHRFFSKSERVMQWWQKILPIENTDQKDITITYHNQQTTVHPGQVSGDNEKVMLVFDRLTRIYFLGKLFSYPIKLNRQTISNLGLIRIMRIGLSYLRTKIFPRKPEVTLEDFFINRFGKELYLTFFKDYTEKVWGTPTNKISATWGAQRVKGLSLSKTIEHFFSQKKKKSASINQPETETSLIEKFLYPKYGTGQMWETVAGIIKDKGGKILLQHEITGILQKDNRIEFVKALNKLNGEEITLSGDYFISSMPVKDLLFEFNQPDTTALTIASQLIYRDFIVVGLLVKNISLKNADGSNVRDNWLYIQEKNVKLGRLQIYNNWGDAMLNDPDTYWLGLEYFCNAGDDIWRMDDKALISFAAKELASINIIQEADVLDGTALRIPKTYPSYVGAYEQFDLVKNYTDQFTNLFLIGRNGMHKYNNQDHSMLTAMTVVDNIRNGITTKENIWKVNTEQDYNG
jgi:protoporphyrinogen oxidase